jgi:hypothetical protein
MSPEKQTLLLLNLDILPNNPPPLERQPNDTVIHQRRGLTLVVLLKLMEIRRPEGPEGTRRRQKMPKKEKNFFVVARSARSKKSEER